MQRTMLEEMRSDDMMKGAERTCLNVRLEAVLHPCSRKVWKQLQGKCEDLHG
jgi:hypothetical protein